jgi:selenide,water dikinase
LGPEDLRHILQELPPERREELLVGLETPDDAAVYRLGGDLALVQTLDFFTPIVDDPYAFGQIAAANALSDIYAMGGRPITAMNILCWPCELGNEAAVRILQGGADKVREAGAAVVGGHTVEDREPKYGLAVAGLVEPDGMLTVGGARPGDILVLTKPLGTGILATALKGDFIEAEGMAEAIGGMCLLNAGASRAAREAGARACTDVTGFGLVGHLLNMLADREIGCVVETGKVPFYPRVMEMAEVGMVPAGAYNNRAFYGDRVSAEGVDELLTLALCDPQTSGGLLLAVPPEAEGMMMKRLGAMNPPGAWPIGRFVRRGAAPLELRP